MEDKLAVQMVDEWVLRMVERWDNQMVGNSAGK